MIYFPSCFSIVKENTYSDNVDEKIWRMDGYTIYAATNSLVFLFSHLGCVVVIVVVFNKNDPSCMYVIRTRVNILYTGERLKKRIEFVSEILTCVFLMLSRPFSKRAKRNLSRKNFKLSWFQFGHNVWLLLLLYTKSPLVDNLIIWIKSVRLQLNGSHVTFYVFFNFFFSFLPHVLHFFLVNRYIFQFSY